MPVDVTLLSHLVRENPFQPATAFWRAAEVAFVAERGLPKGRGLDLGAGDGRLMRLLIQRLRIERELVGVDVDPLEVASARTLGTYAVVHLASADAIPEADASFDWVFSNSTLEHIENITGTLAEVARLLKPGGMFLFTVPSHEFHACLRGPWIGSRQEYLSSVDARCAHLRYWTDEEWRGELDRVGLRLIEVNSYLTKWETQRWEVLSAVTAGVLYRMTKTQPIAIQRRLGLRRGQRLPAPIAAIAARVLAAALRRDTLEAYGCRYYVARRVA